MAAGVQMGQYYNLSNSCIAGATDSKIPDAQSGFEKALNVSLAAQAGSYTAPFWGSTSICWSP